MIYLDNAATSFIKPPSVYRAVSRAMLCCSNPGRGSYPAAVKASDIIYDCREKAASFFHMPDPTHVVFTSNATHALNIAVRSLARPGSRVLVSGFEHNAVMRPLIAIGADIAVAGRTLFDPAALLHDFSEKITGVDLVVCTHVSNVFGYILPIEEIAKLCREKKVPLIIDASQSAGVFDIDMQSLGASFIAMPGHKALFGPSGTGLLLCAEDAEPLIYGGTGSNSASPDMPEYLPERLEAGTMNVPGIAGLLAGLEYVIVQGTDKIQAYENALLNELMDELSEMPRLRLFAEKNRQQSGILSFCVEGIDSESVCQALGQRGIALRGGLHCAPLAHESTGTLAEGTVRVSLSPFVDLSQIHRFCGVMRELF